MKLRIDINICRVCKSSLCSQSLFEDTHLAEKFHYLTGLELNPEDGLPARLCDKCVLRLKVAAEFKKDCLSADTHFRQFINKVNVQFQELTVVQESTYNENDLEILLASNNVSPSNKNQGKCETIHTTTSSFVHEVKLQPQSTARNMQFVETQQQPTTTHVKIQNEPIYVESYELDSDNIQETSGLEETLEEYQTVTEESSQAQVVYISLDNKDEYPFTEQAQSSSNVEKKIVEKSQEIEEKPETIKIDDNRHYCNQCNKSFSTKTNLFRHLATHDGRRPYVCTICQKRFSQNSSLKQHNLLHTGEKPFKCNVCERSFTQAKSLTFHMRRHTGEKPFTCDICNVQFRQKDGMKRHVLLKHTSKEAPREIFSCDICSKVLFSRYSLSNHKRKHSAKEQTNKTVVVNCLN